MTAYVLRARPQRASNSKMSRKRTREPFRKYSFCPSRNARRPIVTSDGFERINSATGSRRVFSFSVCRASVRSTSVASAVHGFGFSNVSETSAMPRRGRVVLPVKIRSSVFLTRNSLYDCSPITQRTASATLLLPEPFGPTIAVTPRSKMKSVRFAKVLNP